jgi:hypothetical protein
VIQYAVLVSSFVIAFQYMVPPCTSQVALYYPGVRVLNQTTIVVHEVYGDVFITVIVEGGALQCTSSTSGHHKRRVEINVTT